MKHSNAIIIYVRQSEVLIRKNKKTMFPLSTEISKK